MYLGNAAQQTAIAHIGTLLFSDLSAPEAPQVVLCGSRQAISTRTLLTSLRSGYRPDLAIFLQNGRC